MQAVIDLGSNTFHLIIFTFSDNVPTVIHTNKQVIGLGKGVRDTALISESSLVSAKKAIDSFFVDIHNFNVSQVDIYGTATLRLANNSADLIQYIRSQNPTPRLSIITGEEEAELIYQGVSLAIMNSNNIFGDEKFIIMDIGGGSVEFIIADKYRTYNVFSLDIGVIFLKELFHKNDPISFDEIENLTLSLIADCEEIRKSAEGNTISNILIGAAGSFETLQDMEIVKKTGKNIAHHSPIYEMDKNLIMDHIDNIIRNNYQDISNMEGMTLFRVEMMTVASVLIKTIIELLGIEEVYVSDYSLKEGAMFRLTVNG